MTLPVSTVPVAATFFAPGQRARAQTLTPIFGRDRCDRCDLESTDLPTSGERGFFHLSFLTVELRPVVQREETRIIIKSNTLAIHESFDYMAYLWY